MKKGHKDEDDLCTNRYKKINENFKNATISSGKSIPKNGW